MNQYLKFLGIEEDTSNQIIEQNNEQPTEELELNEITDDALEQVSLEIDNMTNTVDDSLSVMTDLETQTITNEKLLNDNDTEITEENVMSSQESYYIALGRLGYSKDTVKRISVEQYSTNKERLTISNEGIIDFIVIAIKTIRNALSLIRKKIREFFKMIIDYVTNGPKQKKREEIIKELKSLPSSTIISLSQERMERAKELLGFFVIFGKPVINNNSFSKYINTTVLAFEETLEVLEGGYENAMKDLQHKGTKGLEVLVEELARKTINKAILKMGAVAQMINPDLTKIIHSNSTSSYSSLTEFISGKMPNDKYIGFVSLHKNEIKFYKIGLFNTLTNTGGELEVETVPFNPAYVEVLSKAYDNNFRILFKDNGDVNIPEVIKAHLHISSIVKELNVSEKSLSDTEAELNKMEKNMLKAVENLPADIKENPDIKTIVNMFVKTTTAILRVSSDLIKGYGEFVMASEKMVEYLYNGIKNKLETKQTQN